MFAVILLNCIAVYTIEGINLEKSERDRELEWDELDPDRRRAWNFLGWTKTSWNDKIDSPGGGLPKNSLNRRIESTGSANNGTATSSKHSDKQNSINKYKSAYSEILKKYSPSSSANRQKARREIWKWLATERNSAREAGGGWVNGKYITS